MNKKAIESIKKHEDYFPTLYFDSEGYATVGYGTCIEKGHGGISRKEAEYLLKNKVRFIENELTNGRHGHVYYLLSEDRKAVLIDMGYNLGINGLYDFKKMWAALEIGDYETAAKEMLDSKWAREQVGDRAIELANIMRGE